MKTCTPLCPSHLSKLLHHLELAVRSLAGGLSSPEGISYLKQGLWDGSVFTHNMLLQAQLNLPVQ